MNTEYYTVEQISQLLKIHPKTIQKYIREGKLRAGKIGKSWRVSGHDLSVFVENAGIVINPQDSPTKKTGVRVKVSSVIDIEVEDMDDAIRIVNTITASLNTKPPEYGPSTMYAQYIKDEARVRVTLWGNLQFTAAMIDFIGALTNQPEEEMIHE